MSAVPEAPSRVSGKLKWRWAGEIQPNFWEPGLIDGVLEKKGMTIVYGPSGCGKTAVMVDMAGRIAAGLPWRGMRTDVGLVVYVAAENHWSTENRIWAWQQQHRLADVQLPLAVVESPLCLGQEGAASGLVALVSEAQEAASAPVRLVILDTLARTMSGDENTAKDMGLYVQQLDAIKGVLDTHVLVVHHTGKDESRGARGSSALRAATDHEIELSKEQGNPVGALRLSKIREGGLEGKRFGYRLTPRVVGVNKCGRAVTTVVVEETEAPEVSAAKAGQVDAVAIRTYLDTVSGRVTEKEMKAALVLRDNETTNRGAWKRARDKGIYEVDVYGYVS